MFRDLLPHEIELRVGTISEKGASLLLYKNARVDMDILDETVTPFGWKREHSRDNANCTVSIFNENTGEWISKEDTGTESNTEAQKGLASDSFKRACFNWGIGRELYTSPFVWIVNDNIALNQNEKTKKWSTYDKFEVSKISYDRKVIIELEIVNSKTKKVVFNYKQGTAKKPKEKNHKCAVCDKPVSENWANQSIEKYNDIYCSKECVEKALGEADGN